jgi:hypothetical protein
MPLKPIKRYLYCVYVSFQNIYIFRARTRPALFEYYFLLCLYFIFEFVLLIHCRGFKLYCLCDSVTGYYMKMEVSGAAFKGRQSTQPKTSKGKMHLLVLRLASVLPSGCCIYMDRAFTSLPLAIDLWANDLMLTGTIMKTRKGFPESAKLKKSSKNEKGLTRSTTRRLAPSHSGIQGRMAAVSWQDSKIVTVLSTNKGVKEVVTKRTNKLGKRVGVPVPECILDYNTHMSGVDKADQLRNGGWSVEEALHTKKWWVRLFMGLIDCAIVNSFIIHKKKAAKKLDRLGFLDKLQQELLDENRAASRSAKKRPNTRAETTKDEASSECIIAKARERRNCAVCSRQGRKRTRVYTGCTNCNIYLCRTGSCYSEHLDPKFSVSGKCSVFKARGARKRSPISGDEEEDSEQY